MFIDVMVAPVKTARKTAYIELSTEMSALFLDNGAVGYTECWGSDVPQGVRTSFPLSVELAEDETCAVCFITYPDKATRDACMEFVMADETANQMMQKMPLDGERMIFGGFETIVAL
ncbi:DUF1428 domain-containing protein [Oceaniglobus ichthyenteri]|uniref:DUF1428 domain-containing protein n=1 Tax=Oceaniglobus ichthyenteri TaxID=2136177 RepID=UPI000D3BC363|nr:DUF1428 domain-containing protein [Oceaniglobus ichthyenteri]